MFVILFHRLATPVGIVLLMSVLLAFYTPADASKVRIKDITSFQNKTEGLDGSGDGTGTQFTTQSLVNMMERMGLTVKAKKVKVKNVAAVMVTAKITSNMTNGAAFDLTVSSIGDASSLQGGTLLMTPLADANGTVWGMGQGPVSIIVNNYTLVGRVPNGGKITRALPAPEGSDREIYISLHNPDYTTSHRIAERINITYGLTAYPLDGGTVKVVIPDSLSHPSLRMKFISDIGHLKIVPDNNARVVINEKTGTIVAGQHVTIEPVAIAHGTITVNIQSSPIISQPEPYSYGETVVTQESQISIRDEKAPCTFRMWPKL